MTVQAAPNAATALVQLLGTQVYEENDQVARVWCEASLAPGAQPQEVSMATPFPIGATAVTCYAADATGNVGTGASYVVNVVCPFGYSPNNSNVCQSEWVG